MRDRALLDRKAALARLLRATDAASRLTNTFLRVQRERSECGNR
jgi:hypothetical protein